MKGKARGKGQEWKEGKERTRKDMKEGQERRTGKERQGKERTGKEREGKERTGKERKGKGREGKGRAYRLTTQCHPDLNGQSLMSDVTVCDNATVLVNDG